MRAGWVAAGWVSSARQAVCRCILTVLERIETSEVFSTAIGQATKQVAGTTSLDTHLICRRGGSCLSFIEHRRKMLMTFLCQAMHLL